MGTITDNDPKDDDLIAQRAAAEARLKLMTRVVCICKGINLGRVLQALDGCETVQDVNRKAGTGTGGCLGERCGPRIKILLRKKKDAEK